jgi:hypothetical protein
MISRAATNPPGRSPVTNPAAALPDRFTARVPHGSRLPKRARSPTSTR